MAEKDPPSAIDPEATLKYSLLEYLSQYGVNSASTTSISLLESLQKEWNIDLKKDKERLSLAPLTLQQVWSLGLARKEQFLQTLNQQIQKEKSNDTNDSVFENKFARYLQVLKTRGYFNGTEEGDEEYIKRYNKAKERLREKHLSDLKQQTEQTQPTTTTTTTTTTTSPDTSSPTLSEDQRREMADKFKEEGNIKLLERKYQDAISSYTKAIELFPHSAIYYSNRAASYSHVGEHAKAVDDCNNAIKIDPNYAKAYSRLGLAYFSLGKYKEAVQLGYKKALELDPNNETTKTSLLAAESKIKEQEQQQPLQQGVTAPGGIDFSSLAQMMGNMGQSSAATPGLGNVSNILNSPVVMNMAAQLMSNPRFMSMAQNIMSDPNVMGQLTNMFGSNMGAAGEDTPDPTNAEDTKNDDDKETG